MLELKIDTRKGIIEQGDIEIEDFYSKVCSACYWIEDDDTDEVYCSYLGSVVEEIDVGNLDTCIYLQDSNIGYYIGCRELLSIPTGVGVILKTLSEDCLLKLRPMFELNSVGIAWLETFKVFIEEVSNEAIKVGYEGVFDGVAVSDYIDTEYLLDREKFLKGEVSSLNGEDIGIINKIAYYILALIDFLGNELPNSTIQSINIYKIGSMSKYKRNIMYLGASANMGTFSWEDDNIDIDSVRAVLLFD